jgi:hypothetical protein
MKKSNRYKEFYEQCFQQIDEMQFEYNGNVTKRFRKAVGLRAEDTLAIWSLDVNGPEFLTSGKPTDVIATDKTQIKHVDCLAILCDADCVLAPNSD